MTKAEINQLVPGNYLTLSKYLFIITEITKTKVIMVCINFPQFGKLSFKKNWQVIKQFKKVDSANGRKLLKLIFT